MNRRASLMLMSVLAVAVIAKAVEKWKAEKEARLEGGGCGVKEDEEEENIYAVREEVSSILC